MGVGEHHWLTQAREPLRRWGSAEAHLSPSTLAIPVRQRLPGVGPSPVKGCPLTELEPGSLGSTINCALTPWPRVTINITCVQDFTIGSIIYDFTNKLAARG